MDWMISFQIRKIMEENKMNTILRNEKGKAESNAPIIITLIIIAIVGFLAYKFVPVKWRYIKFADAIQELLNIDYAREYKEDRKSVV